MEKLQFEVVDRKVRRTFVVIHTWIRDTDQKFTIYLDKETGDVLYPLTIECPAPDLFIRLDSDQSASVSLPPTIPEASVPSYASQLREVPKVIRAARRQIREERKRFKNEH